VSPIKTVVFADIAGSTALYEALGNEHAAAAVARLTEGIGQSIEARGGRVVKKLGDGVLGVFAEAEKAVDAMVGCMRRQRSAAQQPGPRMEIRVGLASGDLVEVDGDCYGDAVNVAARLCERAGLAEIWATEDTVQGLLEPPGASFIRLGHLVVRGKADPLVMYRIDWEPGSGGESLTMQAGLLSNMARLEAAEQAEIRFSWRGGDQMFAVSDMPVHVGRSTSAQLCIGDPRVSRQHARLDWRGGAFLLTDLSSYGTWVRFEGSDAPVQLRRDSCLLHGIGEISLGVPFTDASAPTLGFQVSGSSMHLG
jgi:class 3 adenylate cyclase